MIDVPIRVKDALRSGTYRKEYNITVYDYNTNYDYRYIGDITLYRQPGTSTFKGTYDFGGMIEDGYNLKVSYPEPFAFGNATVYGIDPSIPYIIAAITTESESYIEFSYDPKLQGCLLTISQVSFVSADDDTATFEIWSKLSPNIYIDNNNLVSESVSFDERMCSDKDLKFGLCEGSAIEFQYFDKPNILGFRIKVDLKVQYKDANNILKWYTIPVGFFQVVECSRQASTNIIKAKAYNKLRGTYLDADATAQIQEILINASSHQIGIGELARILLGDFKIDSTPLVYKIPKIYAPNSVAAKITASQFHMYMYNSHGDYWVDTRSVSDRRAPSSGYFTVYMMTFWYIPFDEADQYTDDYYQLTVRLYELYKASRPYLMRFISSSANTFVDIEDVIGLDINEAEGHGASGVYVPWREFIYYDYYNSNATGYLEYSDGRTMPFTRLMPDGQPYETFTTEFFSDEFPSISIPVGVVGFQDYGSENLPQNVREQLEEFWLDIAIQVDELASILKREYTEIEKRKITLDDLSVISSEITLRDIQSAMYEINCQYGKLDRVSDLFSGVELNHGKLYPRDDLYPADGLYPLNAAESGVPSLYSKLWADEGNLRSFRYLIITYKTMVLVDNEPKEIEIILQRTVNTHGTDDYNMSNNWLFKNLIWTTEQVEAYADVMIEKMSGIRWFPFEMWCAGLPYVECGDEIEIVMNEGTYTSYVLQRQLKGIQGLSDNYVNGSLDIF